MNAATLLLGKSSDYVEALIDDGRIRWAFDIRCAKSRRSEVRILRQSLLESAGLLKTPSACALSEAEDFRASVASTLPHGFILSPATISAPDSVLAKLIHQKQPPVACGVAALLYPKEPLLRSTDVQQILSCSDKHVARLVSEGALKISKIRRGAKGIPLIFRHSVVEFLKERRMAFKKNSQTQMGAEEEHY